MTLVIEILLVLLFILVYKVLDDQFSLLLYGIFMIYISLNFETYFVTGQTEEVTNPFVVIISLLAALIFVKMIWITSKMKKNSEEGRT